MHPSLKKAQQLLLSLRGTELSREERVDKTLELASLLVEATLGAKTRAEKRQEAWMARMMADPKGRLFLTATTDECFRSQSAIRTTDQLIYLIKKIGIPQFFNERERMQLLIFRYFGTSFPGFFIPLIRRQIRKETSPVLLPEDPKEVAAYFERCREENIRINLNHLGEAILGEEEALRRFKVYLEDLANPMIEYISVKISTIFSQINMVGFAESLEILATRLRILYQSAQKNLYTRKDGSQVHKFVNLDMEEYKDVDLTVALFKKVLAEKEHLHTQAGIVLQSYLPDAAAIQKELTAWAQERCQQGGAPIKIRIVKGANLAMESVESSIRGWEQAPFESKLESDANFKKMLEFATLKEHAEAAHIGVGSHNLFDICYALVLRAENKTEKKISFEMLEGMATPLRRVVKELSGSMLLYCPEAKEKDFHSAVAYLIRRLDENSGSENFLRHFFEMRPDNLAWKEQADRFTLSCQKSEMLSEVKKRRQNRLLPPIEPDLSEPFKNEPDTDFSLPENRKWTDQIFKEWEAKKHPPIPLVIAGEEIQSLVEKGIDPSKPSVPLYHYSLADVPLIEKALACAVEQGESWSRTSFDKRSHLLGRAAQVFRKKRGELIGAMIADGAKTVWEADPEVSEAIDFIEYYRKNWEKQLSIQDLKWSPKGCVLITPPWNFPCSIPAGGIAAALTAGNSVVFKPAPEAVLVGWHVVQAFWEAGIPKEVLQFINCKDEPVGSYLIKHPKVASVVLTGATQTALTFMQLRPGIDLHAETGGKNGMIITAMSDRDLAVRDLINSAFGHAGQKCSACSLAVLEKEVYEDPHFKRQLADATKSLKVASAWNKSAKITPLIRPPEKALLRALTSLEEKESWLVEPKPDPENPHLWSPGIKWGVQENSFTHLTELFGPVLGVMRAENLQEAIRLVNATPYGLTSGLHSLDEREQEYWKKHIVAGNLYINRGITGALVRRQPFGGCKASGFGSGAKAGGPNYVNQLAVATQMDLPHEKAPLPAALLPFIAVLNAFPLSPSEREVWKVSAENYAYWASILKEPTDPSSLLGQDNYFFHIPLHKAVLRLEKPDHWLPLAQVIAACLICETPLEISSVNPLPKFTLPNISCYVEEEGALFARNPSRIRLLSLPSHSLKQQAAEKGVILQSHPVLPHGRTELLHYLREVSLSIDYHRYGYLGLRDPSFSHPS